MTLDDPALAGRLRTATVRRSTYERRTVSSVRPRLLQDVRRVPGAVPKLAAAPPKQVTRTIPKAIPARAIRSSVLRRETVQPVQKSRSKRRRMRLGGGSLRTKLLTGMAVGLCILGVGVGFSGIRTNHKVAAQVQHLATQSATADASAPADVPAETKPTSSVADYHVAADLPRELKIGKLGVDARILRLGILANNQLATPSNIFDTGWYDGSAKPGEAGAMLIDGHVSGPTQNGVFYGMKTLVKGDAISVQRGDGTVFTYHVVTSKVYDADNVDMAAALTPVTPGKPGLNLITCTGKLDSSQTHFQQRVVVFAAQD